MNKTSRFDLLSILKGLKIRSVMQTEPGWIVEAEGASNAVCPVCGVTSDSRHSRCWRTLHDLPLQGTCVVVKLQVGRWLCRQAECPRKIFTERVSGVLPHAQRTIRLSEVHRLVGRALGGRPGEQLLSRLGMPTSRHTLLRQIIKATNTASQPPVRVLGVDDWAWSKGQSFGTILVDLERSEVVDLLPTRSAQSLSEWLKQHREVVVVSRDRQGVYADGTRCGAPKAVQIADRFHLTLNLRQAVERALAVKRSYLRFTPNSLSALPANAMKESDKQQAFRFVTYSNVQKQQAEVTQQRRQEQLELFQTIHQMRARGMKVSEIANQTGLNRRRFDRWLQLDQLPERNRMEPRPGMIESFRGYLQQRWEAGCHHGRTLLAEIRELGYVGAFSRLAHLLSPWRQPPAVEVASADMIPAEATPPLAGRQLSPQVAASLLSKFRTDLTPQQEEVVDAIKARCPGFAVMRELVLAFDLSFVWVNRTTSIPGSNEHRMRASMPSRASFER